MLASWALFSALILVSLVQTEHNRLLGSRQLCSGRMYSSQELALFSGSGSKVRCLALGDCGCASERALFVAMQSCAYVMNLTVVGRTCSFEPMDSAAKVIGSRFAQEQSGKEAAEVAEGWTEALEHQLGA